MLHVPFLFLRLNIPHVQDPVFRKLLKAMLETLSGALNFLGVHHSHDCFVRPYCAAFLHRSGMQLLRGYGFLADMALRSNKRLYSLRPKFHYFHHVLHDLESQLRAKHPWCLNPNMFGCENEDFIGRISRISRKVSPKIASSRTIDRYLVGCKLLFRKHGL